MKKLLIILLVVMPFISKAQFVDDKWADKSQFEHFAMCTTLSTMGGMFVYEFSDAIAFEWGKRNSNIIGAAATMGIGIWKESVDSQPSYKDLTFDLLGCTVGVFVNDWWQKKYSTERNIEKEEYAAYLKWKNKQDGR